MSNIRTEDSPAYSATPANTAKEEDRIVKQALSILMKRMKKPGACLTSPTITRNYLALKFLPKEHEVFSILFLDNRHRVLAYQELFQGTIDGASVYPREVVKAVLKHNANAVILAHNHPSGLADPSEADKKITLRIKDALALIEVRVLDHIIIGDGENNCSFAELGLI